MEMTQPRWYRSPVDYEAWRNGYMPPSEHILIDALSRGDAKVASSFRSVDDKIGWWLVFEYPENGLSPKRAEIIRKLLEMDLETMVETYDKITAERERTSSAQIDEHQLESAENETGAKE